MKYSKRSDFFLVSVYDLARKFGKNKIHLVVDTHGGTEWGVAKDAGFASAFANIFEILKPGGKAFIAIGSTDKGQKQVQTAEALGITCKRSKKGIVLFKY
ncbi:MAG: hypothetical protein V1847_05345 [Candidatus Diapherotrites archaeon]